MGKFPPWSTMTTSDLRDKAEKILELRSYDASLKDHQRQNIDAVVKLAIEFADCRWGINKLSEALTEALKEKPNAEQ